jgi:DNA-binding transcriptional LysR family regulator
MINRGYRERVELRQLKAFVGVATELHFGRAAEQLHLGQPTLSETIGRLERELGTPLFTRTTRRVTLTAAGVELLRHATLILDSVATASAAVRRAGSGDGGTVRLGITPPVAPVLAPHLVALFARNAPLVTVDVQRMWLPRLTQAVADGTVDVALTCGLLEAGSTDVVGEVFCAEPLLVGVRASHRLSRRAGVSLDELAHDVFGATQENLFPAWALCQQQALAAAGVSPPSVDLQDVDLAARRWTEQDEVGWIMLVASLLHGERPDVVLPVAPEVLVPYTMQWAPDRASSAAVARFVQTARTARLPEGWRTQPGHLLHTG